MKSIKNNLVLILLAIIVLGSLGTGTLYGQAPESFNYQAVLFNDQGGRRMNENVQIKIVLHKGSETGDEVFYELHDTETDASGVVNLEIGSINTSVFSTIDWSAGSYFIEIFVDDTSMGISQLLSVPYAMYAKSSEFTEGVTIYGTESAFDNWDKDASDDFNGAFNSLSGIPQGLSDGDDDHQLSESQVDDFVSDNGYLTSVSQNDVKAHEGALTIQKGQVPGLTYSVGDYAQGGIVFWVDASKQHGLVCAKEDQDESISLLNITNECTNAIGDGPYAGEMNTTLFLMKDVNPYSQNAAKICSQLQVEQNGSIYADWYLPSKQELDLMFQNKSKIDATALANGGTAFATGTGVRPYWSSTSVCAAWMGFVLSAYHQYLLDGKTGTSLVNVENRVRAVRAF